MKKAFLLFAAIAVLGSCQSGDTLEGTWQYDGGIYNGNARKASPDMVMQRIYTARSYEAFVTNADGSKTKYGAGTYEFRGDSVLITSKFSITPSQLLNRTQAYRYAFEGDRLIISGTLPSGMVVEEYWKKVK